MQEAVEQGDAARLQEAAHSLKGTAANLGASVLSAICLELEKKGRARLLEGAEPLVSRVEPEFQRACAALEAAAQGA